MLFGEAFGIVNFDVDEFTVFVVNGRIYGVYKTFVRFDIELCVAVAYLLVDSPIDAYAVVFDQVVCSTVVARRFYELYQCRSAVLSFCSRLP